MKSEDDQWPSSVLNTLLSLHDSGMCPSQMLLCGCGAWVCYSVITVGYNSGGYAVRCRDNGGFVVPQQQLSCDGPGWICVGVCVCVSNVVNQVMVIFYSFLFLFFFGARKSITILYRTYKNTPSMIHCQLISCSWFTSCTKGWLCPHRLCSRGVVFSRLSSSVDCSDLLFL